MFSRFGTTPGPSGYRGGSSFFPRVNAMMADDGGGHPPPDGVPPPDDNTPDPGIPGPGNPPLPPEPDTMPVPLPDGQPDWPHPGEMPPAPSTGPGPGPTTPPPPPTPPAPRNAADFALPRTGFRPQDAGGRGNPYVGTGWNNLSNFLNQNNLNYGSRISNTEVTPFDPASNRSQGSVDFDNWMKYQNVEAQPDVIASPNGPGGNGGGHIPSPNGPGTNGGGHLPSPQNNFNNLRNYLNLW